MIRPRRQRAVHNAYIDIDSVTITPGLNFSHWKNLTKQKLMERETKLLNIKMREIERIVTKQLSLLSNGCIYKINNMVKHMINTSISSAIQKWQGNQINRTNKKFPRFRDYFVIAKNTWDGRKKQKIIGIHFWITILNHIQKVQPQKYIINSDTIIHTELITLFM